VRLLSLSIFVFSLACAGFGDTSTVAPPTPEPVAAAAPAVWDLTRQDGQSLVKAGADQGLGIDGTIVLLGPPLAGTENRHIIGSARVVEVWPDLARVEPLRLDRDAGEPVAARALTPEDSAALDAIPLVGKGGHGAMAGASAASAAPGDLVIPDDLKSGSPDSREDALVRYEPDVNATAAIVWVMKNDPNDDVRMKAWRVLRARWKKGTGNPAEHEAAAGWLAEKGGTAQRVEALGAIGERSRSLTLPARHLAAAEPDVRTAAARAVFEIGERTGKRSDAKTLLQGRLDVESNGPLRKKLADWVGGL
jgi:hypothetical protein